MNDSGVVAVVDGGISGSDCGRASMDSGRLVCCERSSGGMSGRRLSARQRVSAAMVLCHVLLLLGMQ